MPIFNKLLQSLKKTRENAFLGVLTAANSIGGDFYEELLERLLLTDMGMEISQRLVNSLKAIVKERRINSVKDAMDALSELIALQMEAKTSFMDDDKRGIILVVGVNGVGKTTSIGKLGNYYVKMGKKVMFGAADTFRAAACEQLTAWADRIGVPIVKHQEGADPGAVVYDAITSFKAKGMDILICDTAGRLHNKVNLMNELEKIRRIIAKEIPDVTCRVMLVLDCTTGQNALLQAMAFAEKGGATDVFLTKLDGTAKGGMAVAVGEKLNLPLRFIGLGEDINDIEPFDANAFAKALLGLE